MIWRCQGLRNTVENSVKYFRQMRNLIRGITSVHVETPAAVLRPGNKEWKMTKLTGKNLKRTAAVLLCSVSLVLPALAQTGSTDGAPPPAQGQQGPRGGGRGGNPEQRLEMMTKELNLSADQQVKVKAI